MDNIFTLPELARFFVERPAAVASADRFNSQIAQLGRGWLASADAPESLEQSVGVFLQRRIAELQAADRKYWRAIIGELKHIRATGGLMPEGGEV
jgi:hypothetical protein